MSTGATNASTPHQQLSSSASLGSGWGGDGGGGGCSVTLLLVLVPSALDNMERSATIRSTWGGATSADSRVLFLLGEVCSGARQARLDAENRRHGDLVQGSFRDTYRNLTCKHLMALKWAAYHCPGARYLLKADDDTFVNMPALLSFLVHTFSPCGTRQLILCVTLPETEVQRSWRSMWRVSTLEYPHRDHPSCCASWALVYSPDVVFLLFEQAQADECFWFDDVYVTGSLVAHVILTHTPLSSLVLTEAQVAAILVGEPPPQFQFGAPTMSPSGASGASSLAQTPPPSSPTISTPDDRAVSAPLPNDCLRQMPPQSTATSGLLLEWEDVPGTFVSLTDIFLPLAGNSERLNWIISTAKFIGDSIFSLVSRHVSSIANPTVLSLT